MVIRRDLLQLGLASAAAALSPVSLQAGTGTVASPAAFPPLFRLLHDSRVPHSRLLAAAFGQGLPGPLLQLAPEQALPGDVTRFWAEELYPQWQRAPVALAGCTGQDLLFCFEQLARDYRLRVQWRAEHGNTAPVPLVSWLIAAA